TAEPHQRAGLLSAFYVQSYLAFSLPAVAAGLSVPLIGLSTAAYLYGAVIILLAIISMIASLWTDRCGASVSLRSNAQSSWPGMAVRRTASLPLAYARPSTSFLLKTWMPGTRPGM